MSCVAMESLYTRGVATKDDFSMKRCVEASQRETLGRQATQSYRPSKYSYRLTNMSAAGAEVGSSGGRSVDDVN
jgi:hypothetical protein